MNINTDAEQKTSRENEFESARKYDEDFNSLKGTNEILKTMKTRRDNSERLSQFGQPQSKNDVSKEKRKEQNPQPKSCRRVKLGFKIDANQIVKAKLKAFTDVSYADINPADYKSNGLAWTLLSIW
jgi:hypothetical protein